MTNVRSFFPEKADKIQGKKDDYQEKIYRHRRRTWILVGFALLLVILVVVALVVMYRTHVYTSYATVSSNEMETASGATNISLGNCVLTYSKDGAHCTDSRGKLIWNQTYDIQDILVDVCDDVVVIAAYNEKEVYVASSSEIMGSFTTTMPIRAVSVAATGEVAVVMADTKVTYYNIYTSDGEMLYNGQATMSGSGYPMSVSLSPSGELLMISYIYLDAGVQKTNIAFYNLGEVGANNVDFLVGVYVYSDLVVPYVDFLDDSTAFAVGDGRLMIYEGSQKPTESAQYLYTDEVQSVFYSDKYIGLVFYADNGTSLYRMNVYNSSAGQEGTFYFNIEYTDIFFGQNNFVVYNDAECLITSLDGTEKFSGTFEKSVLRMIPLSSWRYLLVTTDSLDIIQLK